MLTLIHLHIQARDDPNRGWMATITTPDSPIQLTVADDYVFMRQLIRGIVKELHETWGSDTSFIVDTCVVKDNDDSGMLKPMLEKEIFERSSRT